MDSRDPASAAFRRFLEERDPERLAEVHRLTRPTLHRVAVRLVGRHDAEDLVQATYLAAIERGRSFDGERRLLPWLRKILESRAVDSWRANSAEERLSTAAGATRHAPDELPGEDHDPAAAAEQREAVELLRRAVDGLGEPGRRTLRFVLEEGLAPSEIARRLGQKPSSVRMRLSRAIESLRAKLRRQRPAALLPLWFTGRPATPPSPAAPRSLARRTGTRALFGVAGCLGAAAAVGALAFPDEPSRPLEAAARAAGDPSSSAPATAAAPVRLPAAPPTTSERVLADVRWADDGAPVRFRRLSLVPLGAARAKRGLRVATDASGRLLRSPQVVAGAYEVQNQRRKIASLLWVREPGGDDEVPILRLERHPPITVRVLDESGQPVPDAELHVGACSRPLDVRPDAEGRATLTELMVKDRIHARRPDGSLSEEVFLWPEPGSGETTLRFVPTREVSGILLDEDDQPIAGAVVRAVPLWTVGARPEPAPWPRYPGPTLTTHTRRDGRFRLRIAHHTGRLRMTAESGDRISHVVGSRLDEEITIRMQLRHKLTGRVTLADGRPLAQGLVVVGSAPDGERRAMTDKVLTDRHGIFVSDRARQPRVEVFVDGGEHGRHRSVLDLDEVGADPVEFALEPHPPLRGRILLSDGRPARGTNVVVRSPASRYGHHATVGADGRFCTQARYDGPADLEVVWGESVAPPVARIREVEAGDPIPDIVLDHAKHPAGSIVFTFDRPPGRYVHLVLPAMEWSNRLALLRGRYRCFQLPPGDYQIRLVHEDESEDAVVLASFRLGVDQQLDLGRLGRGRD